MIQFIISSVIAFICLIIIGVIKLQKKKLGDYTLGIAAGVILFFDVIFGFGVTSALITEKTKYVEITNYNIVRSQNAIVIDLSNSTQVRYQYLVKFDTYDMVTKFNDSTKFFLKKDLSFYGICVSDHVTWSNPPYTNFNLK